jgi:dynein light intermediate chain 1, cytosolic
MSGQKLWEKILSDSSQNKRYREGTLILVGNKNSGSRNLISSLQKGPGSLGKNSIYTQLISPDDPIPTSCPLKYSYINGKDTTDSQSDKISKVNIYTLELPELKHLLEFALNSKKLDKTLFAIVLDWENPWRFTQDLETWIDAWHEILGKVVSSLPLEEQDSLVQKVSDYVKSYKDPSAENQANIEDITLPEGVLQVNLGVPIMVICCKSDLVWSVDKNRDQNEKILESVLKTLREFCVNYGASLFYTCTKNGNNINVLYDYIMHRLYGFQFVHKPQILIKDQIFIPSGWDSPNLIKETDYLGSEKQFQDYLPKPKNKTANKEEVVTVSDQEFLLQLKEKIESSRKNRREGVSIMLQRPNPGGEVITTTIDHVQEAPARGSQVKLQEFYQMLLDKGNKEVKENQ